MSEYSVKDYAKQKYRSSHKRGRGRGGGGGARGKAINEQPEHWSEEEDVAVSSGLGDNYSRYLSSEDEGDAPGRDADGTVLPRSKGADFETLLAEAELQYSQAYYRHRALQDELLLEPGIPFDPTELTHAPEQHLNLDLELLASRLSCLPWHVLIGVEPEYAEELQEPTAGSHKRKPYKVLVWEVQGPVDKDRKFRSRSLLSGKAALNKLSAKAGDIQGKLQSANHTKRALNTFYNEPTELGLADVCCTVSDRGILDYMKGLDPPLKMRINPKHLDWWEQNAPALLRKFNASPDAYIEQLTSPQWKQAVIEARNVHPGRTDVPDIPGKDDTDDSDDSGDSEDSDDSDGNAAEQADPLAPACSHPAPSQPDPPRWQSHQTHAEQPAPASTAHDEDLLDELLVLTSSTAAPAPAVPAGSSASGTSTQSLLKGLLPPTRGPAPAQRAQAPPTRGAAPVAAPPVHPPAVLVSQPAKASPHGGTAHDAELDELLGLTSSTPNKVVPSIKPALTPGQGAPTQPLTQPVQSQAQKGTSTAAGAGKSLDEWLDSL